LTAHNTKWAKDGFKIYENRKIEMSLGLWEGKRKEPIPVWIQNIPQGKIKEIELIYDRKRMLCLSYDDGMQPEVNRNVFPASIDLGEIHAISSVSENNEGIIITGRKLRRLKRLRNKKLAELQRKMNQCKKGSRQWKKYNCAKRYILSKARAQSTDTLHKISRKFVNGCVEQRTPNQACCSGRC
jgi:putative transposase